MASRAVVRAGHSPQRFLVRAAVAAPARAAFPLSRSYPLPFRSNSSSTSFPRPLFLLLLLILLLLLEDAGAQQGDGCGHTVLGPESGTLTSINYPHTYPNSTVCEWEIRVKTGERVRIKFGDFDIEDSDSCHFNYLRIYNGIGVGRTEIEAQFNIENNYHACSACIVPGNGNPLQYSCLENPVDRGAWWAAVRGITQSRTRLKRPCMHACMHWKRRWQPTAVFLTGESQGQRNLVGCRLSGRTESDTTEAAAAATYPKLLKLATF